mgnify:CR=1 FL=1
MGSDNGIKPDPPLRRGCARACASALGASIAIAEGTLTLHNHDGTPASVELLFPRENDALEAGREAAAVASVKGGGGAS